MNSRITVLVVVLVALAGCVNYALVPPARTTVTGSYSVAPTLTWNKATLHGDERWTIDGNSLQELIFISATDGKRILSSPLGGPTLTDPVIRPSNDKLPPYQATMTPIDIKELVEASITQLGAVNLQTSNFRPAKFGNASGFRFDLAFAQKNGLLEKGFAVGAQVGDRLNLIIFTAASVYYYDRDFPEAQRIVDSIEFPKA